MCIAPGACLGHGWSLGTDSDLLGVQVEVPYLEMETLGQSQPGPVEQSSQEAFLFWQVCQEEPHLIPPEDDGQAAWRTGAGKRLCLGEGLGKDVLVEEAESVEGLVLCGSGGVSVGGQVREEGPDVLVSKHVGMPVAVEADVSADGVCVSACGVVCQSVLFYALSDGSKKGIDPWHV